MNIHHIYIFSTKKYKKTFFYFFTYHKSYVINCYYTEFYNKSKKSMEIFPCLIKIKITDIFYSENPDDTAMYIFFN